MNNPFIFKVYRSKDLRKFLITCLLVFLSTPLWSQRDYSITDSLVNDYSQMLTWLQRDSLEQRLRTFNKNTSNQIVVIITPRLYGEEIIDLAVRIGYTWGVGQADLDNGVVILIKSKCEEEPFGDASIVTGRGLEGALPDAFCRRIIDDQMISHLSDNHYFAALNAALDIIEPVCLGEYNYQHYQNEHARRRTPDDIAGKITLWLFVSLGVGYLFFRIRHRKSPRSALYDSSSINDSDSDSSYSSHDDDDDDSSSSFDGFGGGDFGGGGAHSRF